ncbi:hypothetical protein [Streptomyces sp. AS02]|uniref:hypothetical protein n=1 Tax=Streptomyces sp. AS02 TaxID=2938946 RepID=UPI0020227EDF|nr:hypothetical protein [Streptomyces sp. AS02]MCL8016894.1 hypothetical protein [Streptomyces sp. AS02]
MSEETPNVITYDGSSSGSWFVPHTDVQALEIAPPPIVHITGSNGQPLVSVHPDGRTEFGDGYNPDEAARQFWDAVQRLVPSGMVRHFGAPLTASINAHLKAGEEAERKVQRLDRMATAWAERLPQAISRDTAVEAIHQVTRGDAG